MNCSSRVSSSLTGRPVFNAASARISSTNISCLPPKPPPTRLQNTRTLSGGRSNRSASARRVRNGTCVEERTVRTPSSSTKAMPPWVSRARVLHALRRERAFISHGGGRQSAAATSPNSPCVSAAILRCRIGDAILGRLAGMDHRRALGDRCCRIDHMRQYLVSHLEAPAAFFGGAFAGRHHRRDFLADKPHDIVEHAGIVGVHPVFLVPRGREQFLRRVLVGQDGMDARHGERRAPVDRDDSGVRMRRAKHLDVEQAFDLGIEGVALRAAHHVRPGGRRAGCGRTHRRRRPSRRWSCR